MPLLDYPLCPFSFANVRSLPSRQVLGQCGVRPMRPVGKHTFESSITVASTIPQRVSPHDEQTQRAELVERYCNEGLQVTDSVKRVADELNVKPRTIYRARKYRDAILALPSSIRDVVAGFVNDKKVTVAFIYTEFVELSPTHQQEMVEAWRRGAFPETLTIGRDDGAVLVSVPTDRIDDESHEKDSTLRESYKIQALLGKCGERLGFKVWIPKRDRAKVHQTWQAQSGVLLSNIPLSVNNTVIKTIQEIDVLWMKQQSIVRAFEVEHTTSIYSGLLRMADLLALLPNCDINLHIVAPGSRRGDVFNQIRRHVFACLERAPLSEICSFLSYSAIEQIQSQMLEHSKHSIVEEYAEYATDPNE